jgi:hypothetical protein
MFNSDAQIDDDYAILDNIDQFPNINDLRLEHIGDAYYWYGKPGKAHPFQPARLEKLAGLTKLENLTINKFPLTYDHLRALEKLTKLRSLSLHDNVFKNKDLAFLLPRLPHLEELSLVLKKSNKVEILFESISRADNLTKLNLCFAESKVEIEVKYYMLLARLKKLSHLTFHFDVDNIDELKYELPELQIDKLDKPSSGI